MSTVESPLATLQRIAATNGEFGAVAAATPDFMIRVGESMLKKQSVDLSAAHTALSELVDHGDRLTAAFRALGQSNGMQAQINAHRECEASMLAFAAALARAKGGAA
ncbi:hypothetical protein JY438_05155 [Stenotrophomonas maltophilia]|jgi:hypothetical protein|uniref:hypothetical protein n=1 Tax=Stenotrophomonas TaxID=40323 RepID=UPI00126990A8|nr:MULTISPECIES: hypothetical protein [Stenotrophomonas]MBN4995149.1 hypothetical protein [Stenotrophomonas maltophilia]MCI1152018.1 hypothetical protein [Stenotrophomonas maltophilia]MCU1145463.1 hypothetical protein [Stenotrophomonas maltophilia]HDX0923151.1 hypothetical protein [Stenotrophomonas maltophilia]